MPKKLLPFIILTGLIAGTADIILACISAYIGSNISPDKVLRFVASGVFGKYAYTGSAFMIVLGLLFHFMIAIFFTAIFFFIYHRVSFIRSNKIVAGIQYGIIIWCVMNLIVLPLSNAPALPFNTIGILTGIFILIVAIGLPVVYFANKYYSQKKLGIKHFKICAIAILATIFISNNLFSQATPHYKNPKNDTPSTQNG